MREVTQGCQKESYFSLETDVFERFSRRHASPLLDTRGTAVCEV